MTTQLQFAPRRTLRERLGPWIALQELPKHLANVLPFLLGTTLAYWYAGQIDWTVFAVAALALFLLTDGTYIANEYFDYDADRINDARIGGNDRVGVTTTGGTRVLVKGLIARPLALRAAVICFLLAIPLGLYLQLGLGTGPLTVPLGVLATLIGWFYSAPPVKASYRGLGELFIAIGQGLVIFGAFYVQAGAHAFPLLVSLPWFLALPALKIIRQYPDYDADLASGKRGLTALFGRERMARVYVTLIVLSIFTMLPIALVLESVTAALLLIPAFLLARSALVMSRGQWRVPARLEQAAIDGFVGMLTIPVVLTAAFLIPALLP